jgi:hypothetical protein
MIYTVVWVPDALDELTALWLNAADRAAVTDASNRIDAILRTDPYGNSQPDAGGWRAIAVSPLVVSFSVSDLDCLVTVQAVWRQP